MMKRPSFMNSTSHLGRLPLPLRARSISGSAVSAIPPSTGPQKLREPPMLQKNLLWFFGVMGVMFLFAEVTDFNDPVADFTYVKNGIFYMLYYFMYLRCRQDEKTTRQMIIWIMIIAAVAGLEAIREGFDYGIGKYNPFRRASGPFGEDWHHANRAGVASGSRST